MKTLYKTATMLALLGGLAFAAKAQVIGDWQSAPLSPTPANDEGWTFGGSGGFGAQGSIFDPTNTPNRFEMKAGVAAGYAKSLDIHEDGYGNVRLFITLNATQIGYFTNNNKINFTFSCRSSADEGSTAGYLQMVQFQCNSSGGGFQGPAVSTAGGFSETGDTGNNASGQPIFYFYSGSPARQQVVTWSYQSLKPAIIGSSYAQFVFIFQSGGGAPTNIYINNVNFSGAANPEVIIDRFDPTNAYAGTNDYNIDSYITNVYNLWTGYGGNNAINPDAGDVTWDNTQDAGGGAVGSGSLKLLAHFTNVNQYLLWDRGPGNVFALNPPVTNGYSLLTFEFDLKVDPSSPQYINGSTTNYAGPMEAGPVPPYGPIDFGTYFFYDVTNTGWIHMILPVNAAVDPTDLLSITGIYFKQYAFGLNGTAIVWIDNIKFTYTNLPPPVPVPVMGIEKAEPGLRFFTGGTDTYGRSELIKRGGESWVGATAGSPATYSFTVRSIPANMAQTHIFLIPNASIPDTSYNGQDYNATNGLWLTIGPSGIAVVSWKTNYPGANPYTLPKGNIALTFTNTPVVGTWTLSFTGANNGTVTGPGGSPQPFVITNGSVATDFADPVDAFFGCQASANAALGNYEDWDLISITGTANPITEDLAHEPSRVLIGTWATAYQGTTDAGAAIVVTTNDLPAYWVRWSTPAIGFDVGSATNLMTPPPWKSPQYYSTYADAFAPYGAAQAFGTNMWVLEPKDNLPTASGLHNADNANPLPGAPDVFFWAATNTTYP